MKFFHFLLLPVFLFLWSEISNSQQLDQEIQINLHDKASLQRGAKWYMNYCIGCHSLKYIRYNTLANGIGIGNFKPEIVSSLLKNNLIFNRDKISDVILSSLAIDQGKVFFGVAPPDLTLESRIRGTNWIYNYLKSFYLDEKAPWGVNNKIFPQVAMPNVLINLQGAQLPVYGKNSVIDHFVISESGSMSPEEFDLLVKDLTNFLAYVAEPAKLERHKIGFFVLIFMFLLASCAYLLKKEYWKNIMNC